MQYQIKGEGHPIVFLHGWASSSMAFKYQLDELSEKYKVIAIDLKGHGVLNMCNQSYDFKNMAGYVNSVLGQLGLENITLAGWSMGVPIVFEYIKNGYDKISSLILISGNAKFAQNSQYKWGQPAGPIKAMEKKVKKDLKGTLRAFLERVFEGEKVALDDWQTIMHDIFSRIPLPAEKAAESLLIELARRDYRSYLSKIKLPTLIVHGSEDVINPIDAGVYLNKNIKNSRLKIMNKCAHAPFITRKDDFHRIVDEFIGGVEND